MGEFNAMKMDNIVLIGGGDQAHYTIDIINKECKYNIIGIIDAREEIGSHKFGYKIIGRQEDIKELIQQYNIQGGVISIGDNWTRYYVANQIKKLVPKFKFVNAIHPSIPIGDNVIIGEGVVAMAGCIFNPRAVIGDHTFFATGAQVEHDCVIGNYASISAGSITGGYVKLGEFAAITLGVTVLDRKIIGKNSVIGAGSLVVKDIPDNVLAYGNPTKIIRTRKEGEKFLGKPGLGNG
jgi:sugar O-acyltransferase (sialic acid O-acetyltransferase NeuD family)